MTSSDRETKDFGSMTEMRFKLYGGYMDETNLNMPVAHLLLFMQEMQSSMNTYRGLGCNKNPCDAWVYQEIIHETQPEVIIELGRQYGGSTLWLRDVVHQAVESNFRPVIISVDTEPVVGELNSSPYIIQIQGNSEDPEIIERVKILADNYYHDSFRPVMVIDDCAHTYENVLANLRNYGPMVTPGCYYIVEDTLLNHGVVMQRFEDKKAGMEAVFEFLKENDDFQVDKGREKFFITNCPNGFLKRMK